MLDLLALLTIEIGINPEITEIGSLLLTWHGVFTAIGIAAGVTVSVAIAQRKGFIADDVYSVALVAIPGGIIGARALFVIERWSSFEDDPVQIIRLDEGGIAIYGMIIGGVVAGLGYSLLRKFPLRRALDVAAPGIILGMAIGRIGDLINGEHFAETSSLPWAVRYTHHNSPSVFAADSPCNVGQFQGSPLGELCAQHPAVGYEMLGDLIIFGILLIMLRYVMRDGVVFFSFLLMYSLMRLGLTELRLDSREIILGLTTPQVTALFLIPISVAGLLYCWLRPSTEEAPETAAGEAVAATGPPAG